VDRLGLVVARVAWGRSHARIASRRERAFLVSKVWPTMCQATELTSRALAEAFENLRSQGHAQRNAPMPICRLLGSKNQALNWAERLRLR
jgi:hypothetical protein